MKENFVEFEGENKGCKISVVMKIIIYIISDTDGATYLKKKKKKFYLYSYQPLHIHSCEHWETN